MVVANSALCFCLQASSEGFGYFNTDSKLQPSDLAVDSMLSVVDSAVDLYSVSTDGIEDDKGIDLPQGCPCKRPFIPGIIRIPSSAY